VKRLQRAVLIIGLVVATATVGAMFVGRVHALDVEVPPDWRAGPLAVYLLSFPGDGSTLSGRVSVSIAVWNANPDDTVRILLDGEVAAEIDHEGVFTYSWKLRDSHHLAVVSDYAIFAEATFWVKPPPPAPPTVPLQQFLEELEKQRERIVLYMVMATACGVPAGIWTKKKTKIRSEWAFTLPAAVLTVGYWRMAQLYALIPFGVAWALTYWLARDYADLLGLIWLRKHGIKVEELYLDDEGRAVIGVSPRYWRSLFILRKQVEIEDEYPALLEYRGFLKCVCVKSREESDDKITLKCSRELAELLMKEGVLKRLNDTVEELSARNTLLESSMTAAAVGWVRRETKARLLGVMRGELGKIDPKGLLDWMKKDEQPEQE